MIRLPGPAPNAVCDAHGVIANEVGILSDLNGKAEVVSYGGAGGKACVEAVVQGRGSTSLGNAVCTDVKLVLEPLAFRGPQRKLMGGLSRVGVDLALWRRCGVREHGILGLRMRRVGRGSSEGQGRQRPVASLGL